MRTFQQIFYVTLFFASSLAIVQPAQAGPECTCRHSGGEVAEGQTACIKSPTGMKMARCETVLNNTSWKMLDAPCPYSQAPIGTVENYSIAQLDFSKKD
jgi:hypothetical protein